MEFYLLNNINFIWGLYEKSSYGSHLLVRKLLRLRHELTRCA